MYTGFFGLNDKPFAITPDPRYLYLSERHAEALAHLMYGINESGGFIQLTGEVGTGKTTVVRTLLARVPHHADVAVILNPRISPIEFLLTICEELGVEIPTADRDSAKQMVDALNRRLLKAHAEGRRIIVIVDEAQNLSADVLEQVRLLTNLETPTHKLLQIILIGQPELRDLLDRNELRQLAQRITGRYHLEPLSREETKGYIRHRLRVAGGSEEIFTTGALGEVHRLSKGIPRVINVSCDRALLGAYTRETRKVTAALVRRAAGEVYGRRFLPRWFKWMAWAAACTVAGALAFTWRLWLPSEFPWRAVNRPTTTPATTASNNTAPAPRASVLAPTPLSPTVSLNEVLLPAGAGTGDTAAYRRLLSLWGAAMAQDKDPCGQASKAGLACLDQRGSWAQVKMLNRPAILSLADNRGERHRVLLAGLDDRSAMLAIGETNQRVSLDELSQAWFGEFTVIWKPKTTRTRLLSVGMKGEDVRWLRRSLNALRGAAADPENGDLYDQALADAVESFQREHKLNVDGIAGVQTQVVLDTVLADPASPQLVPNPPRGG
jgi:general secretion pathway protein A